MTRLTKFLLLPVAVAAACLGLVAAGVYLLASPDRIAGAISASLLRAVTYGRMDLDWGETLRLSADHVQVAGRKGFGESVLLSVERADIRLSLLGLVRGKLGTGSIDGFRVSLVRGADGVLNVSDLMAGGGWPVPIQTLHLTRGEIRYEDRPRGSVETLRGITWNAEFGLEDEGVSAVGALAIDRGRWGEVGAVRQGMSNLRVEHDLVFHRFGAGVASLSLPAVTGWIRVEADSIGPVYAFSGVGKFESTGGILDSLSGRVYGGRIQGRVEAKTVNQSIRLSGEIDIGEIRTERVLGPVVPLNIPLKGAADMTATFRSGLNAHLDPNEHWQVEGRVVMAQGQLINWDWLVRAGRGVRQLGDLDLTHVAVSNLEAPFEADETQIRLKGLSLLAEDIDCQLTGTIGHGMNGRLDLVLDLGVPMRRLNLGGFGQLLGAFMRNDGGRVPLRFQIGGTKKEPQVRTSLLSGLMRN